MKKYINTPSNRQKPKPTPTPMPAFAPVDRPWGFGTVEKFVAVPPEPVLVAEFLPLLETQ